MVMLEAIVKIKGAFEAGYYQVYYQKGSLPRALACGHYDEACIPQSHKKTVQEKSPEPNFIIHCRIKLSN